MTKITIYGGSFHPSVVAELVLSLERREKIMSSQFAN